VTDAERLDRLVARARDLSPEVAVAEARLFFDGLGPGAAAVLADERPDLVGELDGAPAAVRYRANNLRLNRARRKLWAKIASGETSERSTTAPDGARSTRCSRR
jgi:hypothetical protein